MLLLTSRKIIHSTKTCFLLLLVFICNRRKKYKKKKKTNPTPVASQSLSGHMKSSGSSQSELLSAARQTLLQQTLCQCVLVCVCLLHYSLIKLIATIFAFFFLIKISKLIAINKSRKSNLWQVRIFGLDNIRIRASWNRATGWISNSQLFNYFA